jgi:hypothetical protein
LHLPHSPAPPHTASIATPARRDASRIVVPCSTVALPPSGSNLTLNLPNTSPPDDWVDRVENHMRL